LKLDDIVDGSSLMCYAEFQHDLLRANKITRRTHWNRIKRACDYLYGRQALERRFAREREQQTERQASA
jgi:hypothetical protein